MKFPRSAGVLLHPTSLPSAHGIGDLGPDAHRFAEWLAECGMRIWQMLPLGPTGYGDSPYQCFSAFAGNPLLLHIPGTATVHPAQQVDFGSAIAEKRALLAASFRRFTPDARYHAFVQQQRGWLEDYALFMAIKGAHAGVSWTEWPRALAERDPAALAAFRGSHAAALDQVKFEQYHFFAQYDALRRVCHARNIRLMGDVPIYLGNPNGLVIWSKSEPGKIVHHMGDTGIYSDMALVHELYQPTIGIVPIGDRYTMGAKHAALACKRYFKFKTVFPCHYATFGVLAPNADEFVALMKGNDVRVPKAGETVTL